MPVWEACMRYFVTGATGFIGKQLVKKLLRRKGHVVNISSIGVLTNAPRFSVYLVSKAALDTWALCQQRVCRSKHQLYDDQHAAGAHPHDCAHRPVQQCAHAGP
jgi:NAD(P)-dependent dehydrogenase (short-subunit alcohol dehydrogenase family)